MKEACGDALSLETILNFKKSWRKVGCYKWRPVGAVRLSYSQLFCVMILILIIIIIVAVYLFTVDKKFYIALDKANWSQPKMEKSYIYIKA